MIKVIGKINVFITKKKTQKGEIIEGSTAVELTDKDGSTLDRLYYEVKFGKENFPAETLSKLKEDTCYVIDVKDGWLTFRCYANKNGYKVRIPQIFIKEGKCVSATAVDPKKKEEAKKAVEARKASNSKDSPLEGDKSEELPF